MKSTQFNFKKILLTAAHPDDIEFGMGGTLVKLAQDKNKKIKIIVFSTCEEQLGNKGITKEFENSMKFFKIENYKIHELPNTKLPEFSDKIRGILEDAKSSFNPDAIFTMSKDSIHQDHKSVAIETERVFRNISIFAFEDVKSCPNFKPKFYHILDKKELCMKIDALNIYKTQYRRYYHNDELIKSLSRFRGAQVGEEYAEAFEIVRLKL